MAPEPQSRSATKQETLDNAWLDHPRCLLRVDQRQRHHAAQFTGLIMTYDLSPVRRWLTMFARATPLRPRHRCRHYASASITRYIAGCFRFLTFTQCFDLPA
jgi:hypothetical protein